MSLWVWYALIAVLVAATASLVSDRFRSNAGLAAILTGLLWPIVIVGVVQFALWIALVKSTRAVAARRPEFEHATAALLD